MRSLPSYSVAKAIGTDLALLLPELPHDTGVQLSRDRLFGAVVELIAARAHSAPPVLLAFDDIQWCDGASAELLHYAARMNRHRPILIALAARSGELPGNESMRRVMLSLKREELLEEFRLGPLDRGEVSELVRTVNPVADIDRVFSLSAGNPLFALEIARSMQQSQSPLSSTLTNIVRERIDRLQESSRHVLRWSAAIGPMIGVRQLAELTGLDLGEIMAVLEDLERHNLLCEAPKNSRHRGDYIFAHNIVCETVYTDLSAPRRRLMHLRIAQVLNNSTCQDEGIAAEIARHAALGSDFSMAAAACVSAGRRCLRLFAGSEAAALAEIGMHYAKQLGEPERVQHSLELVEIRMAACRPDQPEESARLLRELAECALDYGCHEHARLGFQMLSHLHLEKGDCSGALRDILQAEQVSRGADDKERAVAMAEAARCLILLERDLMKAKEMALQAGAISARLNIRFPVIPDAEGLLRLHEGKTDEAASLFQQARLLARNEGNRLDEFRALEHLFMLELQRKRYDTASALGSELVSISNRLRDGSDAAFARALAALSLHAAGKAGAAALLQEGMDHLRASGARHRLVYMLIRGAELDLRFGDPTHARLHAQEALELAQFLERPSEIALAHALLAQAAEVLKDQAALKRHTEELHKLSLSSISCYAQQVVYQLVGDPGMHRQKNHSPGRLAEA